ncbi:MAG: type II toxin-antitoxin system PemK/MazF family toxin [Bdellovibrio sp.]
MSNFSVGEVVLVDLNPTRPCMVINVHPRLDLITVFPITDSNGKSGKVFVEIKDLKSAGLRKTSVIDTYQIRTLSTDRIIQKMGSASENEIFECRKSIALIYEIDEDHLN